MYLETGLNFINVYTQVFFVRNFGAKAKTYLEKRTFVRKKRVKNVDEIDTWKWQLGLM
jgi:hypothetical protein